MFADMAYGLILLAAGTLILRKARPRGGLKDMAGLMVECGISTFILGFLTGGFFGDAVSVLGSMFGKEWTPVPTFGAIRLGDVVITLPMNLLEGNNPLYMLIISIGLGAVHLAPGRGDRDVPEDPGGPVGGRGAQRPELVGDPGGIGPPIFGQGAGGAVRGRGHDGAGGGLGGRGFGRITGIFSAVYNGATGYLGDLLSYSRLMALMLAGSVIASVFNQLGALGGGHRGRRDPLYCGILYWTYPELCPEPDRLLRAHHAAAAFGVFGKWYRDGGRPFRPLNVQTKYVDIKED